MQIKFIILIDYNITRFKIRDFVGLKLTWMNISKSDAGSYVCNFNNITGSRNESMEVVVYGMLNLNE